MTDPARLLSSAPEIVQAAEAVLRQTPLNSSALGKLAIARGLGRQPDWPGIAALSERVSRRDLNSELLLIDLAAQQDNMAPVLRHYDHVLSTYPAAKNRLFPLLARELAKPDLRAALVPMASRPWLRDFVVNAVDYDVAPAYLMDFYGDLAGKVPVAELQAGARRILMWLQANHLTASWGEYADRMPGIAPHAFDQLGFTETTLDPRFAPMTWQFFQSDAVETEPNAEKLIIRVAPENGGWAARRLTWLKPGTYAFGQSLAFIAGSPRAQLEWQVTCFDSQSPPLLQQVLPLENAGVPIAARVMVPDGCPVQEWRLRASANRAQSPSLAQISGLSLVRQ